jgi:hypothetical protein
MRMGGKATRLRFAVEVGWKRPFTSIGMGDDGAKLARRNGLPLNFGGGLAQ